MLAIGSPGGAEWIIIVVAVLFCIWFRYSWAAEQERRKKQRGFSVVLPEDERERKR